MSTPKPRGRSKKQPTALPQPDPVSLEESKDATGNMEITDHAPQEENTALSTKKPRGRPKKQPVPQEEVPGVEETPEVIQEHADSQETKAPLSPVSLVPAASDVVPAASNMVPGEEKLTHLLQEWYGLSKDNFREELDTTRFYIWCAYRAGIVNILNLTAHLLESTSDVTSRVLMKLTYDTGDLIIRQSNSLRKKAKEIRN